MIEGKDSAFFLFLCFYLFIHLFIYLFILLSVFLMNPHGHQKDLLLMLYMHSLTIRQLDMTSILCKNLPSLYICLNILKKSCDLIAT